MMARIGALTLAALLSASVTACDKPGEREQNAEGRANRQAEEAQNAAARKTASAQAEADQKIASARADFEKARADYLQSRQTDLDKLNQTIADLETKVHTSTGKAKAALDTSMPAIRAQRDAFTNDLRTLQTATPTTWDGVRTRIDNEWEALETSVNKAS